MLNVPKPPQKPNYDDIIKSELSIYENITNESKGFFSKFFNNGSTNIENPAYAEAVIENVVATIISKMDKAYSDYLRELDEYEKELLEYKTFLSKQFEKNKTELQNKENDYFTIKSFYDQFQTLAKSKFDFASKLILKGLKVEEDDG